MLHLNAYAYLPKQTKTVKNFVIDKMQGIVIILTACGLVNKSKNVLSLVNLLLSLGHSGLLVDYYLLIIDKGGAQQALYINWLCSHISDEDIISPCNIDTI